MMVFMVVNNGCDNRSGFDTNIYGRPINLVHRNYLTEDTSEIYIIDRQIYTFLFPLLPFFFQKMKMTLKVSARSRRNFVHVYFMEIGVPIIRKHRYRMLNQNLLFAREVLSEAELAGR